MTEFAPVRPHWADNRQEEEKREAAPKRFLVTHHGSVCTPLGGGEESARQETRATDYAPVRPYWAENASVEALEAEIHTLLTELKRADQGEVSLTFANRSRREQRLKSLKRQLEEARRREARREGGAVVRHEEAKRDGPSYAPVRPYWWHD